MATELEPDRNPVEILAEEFVQRCRNGESPSIEEYTEKHPELADQINRLFPSIAMMERFGEREHLDLQSEQSHASLGSGKIEQIGDYRIVREIGRGGMGVVYEAEQESLGRRVALKVLANSAVTSPQNLQRFEREAQAAASLHHSNIVPVFGVGEQAGLHYYVMQFIDGVGLNLILRELKQPRGDQDTAVSGISVSEAAGSLLDGTAADSLHLRPPGGSTNTIARKETVELSAPTVESVAQKASHQNSQGSRYWKSVGKIGLQLAEAIEYAHSQGVLHRDIKPSNLLLDERRNVWITDFGLAKHESSNNVTRTGDIVGTLQYMAPEQLHGESSAASDIYGLGVTLYELLTLRPAIEDSHASQLIQQLSQGLQPPRPRKINARIPRDLETIVLKSISHEPGHRYPSAAALADDLQRFLDDRPIRARRVTAAEQLWRWCRRNPAVATLSSVAVLLLILVVVTTSAGYIREAQQRERIEATLDISLDALDKVYERFAPDRIVAPSQITFEIDDGETIELPAQPVLSKETAALLADILPVYDRFAQQDSDNLSLKIEAAKANRRVGDIRQRLGEYEQAEAAYKIAIAKYQKLADDADDPNQFVTEIARIQNELGNVLQASKNDEQSLVVYRAARDSLEATESSDPEVRFELARTYYFLGKRVLHSPGEGPPPHASPPPHLQDGPPSGRHPNPPPHFERPRPGHPPRPNGGADHVRRDEYLSKAITILNQLQKESPAIPEYRYLLALCHRDQAREFASEDMQKAIDILESLSRQYPTAADYRYQLGETFAAIDIGRLRHDELRAAEDRFRSALKCVDDLVTKHPSIPEYAHSRAMTLHKLSEVVQHDVPRDRHDADSARYQEAAQLNAQAVDLQRQLVEKFPASMSYRLTLGRMQQTQARYLRDFQRLDEARTMLEASIDGLNDVHQSNPSFHFVQMSLLEHKHLLADVLSRLGEEEEAARIREQAESHRIRFPGPMGPRHRPGHPH